MASISYQRLKEEVEDDSIQPNGGSERGKTSKNLRPIWIPGLTGMALGFLVSLLVYTTMSFSSRDSCTTRKTSVWSPALQIYDDGDLSIQRFDGALRAPNKFRGPPNPSIDDAWNEITYPKRGLVRLSKDQLDRINASDFAAEYTEEMGGGYLAGIEVFHQLHCVNMLRQASYMDYYLPINEEWRDKETLRYHLDHCIDMLRQRLMCDPDVGMVTYVWAKGFKQAFPDFSTVHMCRPYSKILDWAHANGVHGGNIADIERAPGAAERETRP